MKNIFKYTFAAVLGAMTLAACTNEYKYDGVGEADKATAAGAYFLETGNPKNLEVEPGAEEFDLTLTRTNTESAQTVGIAVVSDEAGIFEVPSSAQFAAGENTATIHVTAPRAEEGGQYSLTVGIVEEQQSIYSIGAQTYTVNMVVQKWEKLGTGYWVDGIISTYFGVNPNFAYAVQVEKMVEGNGAIHFRFVAPYSHAATGKDDLGAYIGYPYNAGAGDEEDHVFLIDITSNGAFLHATSMGINWGYGEMFTGSVYGNVSNNLGAYPLGVYNEEDGYIYFPINSLFLEDEDGPVPAKKNPSFLFLSAEAFINAVSE